MEKSALPRMSFAEAMSALEAAGSAQTRKTYGRHGITGPMFGVSFDGADRRARSGGGDPDGADRHARWDGVDPGGADRHARSGGGDLDGADRHARSGVRPGPCLTL